MVKQSRRKSMKQSRSMRRSRSMKRRGGGFFDFFQSPTVNSNSQVEKPMVEEKVVEEKVVENQNPEELGMMDKVIGTVSDSASETIESVKGDLSNQVGLVTEEAGQLVDQGKDAIASVQESVLGSSSDTAAPGVAPVTGQGPVEEKKWYQFWGGRRRSKQMMGGRYNSASDLAFYAAPVTDARVAEPTYMMQYTGGKKSRRKRRKYCKKSCKKRHRHHKR
jgi:hypothetical protein